MIFRKRYNEGDNMLELMAIVKEMAALDNDYPELGTPSKVRQMMANGNFSIEKRPWDFLIGLGYSMINLLKEQNDTNGQAISLLQDRMERALKYPMKWMYNAITPKVQRRYLKVAGENLPQAPLWNRRMPRSLKGKCKIFAWYEYAQLLYVLRSFCSCPYIIDLPTSGGEYWGVLSVREMRDLVASMECPPKEILQELDQEVATIELKELVGDLRRAQKRANTLAFLGYKSAYGSTELRALEEIIQTLGVEVKFAEGELEKKLEVAPESSQNSI